ncbi:murein L,D-transpeptidase [Martelella mediterranea DSM 17316]|uniref:Murein L,D-transpeptidase n=1 Tax=Martelella mediterranea DSM 17316 TaxID=1122214 RepID=A0A1U9Z207_9HYPH|nr:murein L,D-transpeptidase [Martelella mediterranea DSM 17316]
MRNKLSVRVSSVALAVAVSAAFVPSAANALTLMDILRGRQKESQRAPVVEQQPQVQQQKQVQRTYSAPKVAPPKYYAYRADPVRMIDIGEIRDPVVTGSITPDEAEVEETTTEVAALDQGSMTDAVETETTVAIAQDDPRQYLADAQVKAIDDVASAIEDYYSNGGELIWVQDGKVSQKARAAMRTLGNADVFGLEPDNYRVQLPDLLAAENEDEEKAALMQFELALSAKVLAYMQDAKRGRVDPNRISEFHDLKRNPVDLGEAIDSLAGTVEVAAFIESYNPQNQFFQDLKAELAELRSTETVVEPIVFTGSVFIRPGQTNQNVPSVVKAIERKASPEFKVDHAEIFAAYDGVSEEYTPELVTLVKDFQKSAGLYVDGVVGPNTVRAFDVETNDDRTQKVLDAMERLRWLPDDFGPRYVFINQPAYRVYYHDDNGESFDMGVVVGNPTNQTYFFKDEIETVEFNPYWGIPRSIVVNEYLPKLRANPSYFDQIGYEVSYNGRRVSSSSVNWASAPMVDVRQPPGERNALGQLKILFPNDHAIYMHDTPQKSYFERDMRALSHGCVRLSDPNKMAAAVLGVPETDIDDYIATGKNTPVDVPEKFPVYVAYFTAWPDANGEVQYYDDVYDRDMYLKRAMDAESEARVGS